MSLDVLCKIDVINLVFNRGYEGKCKEVSLLGRDGYSGEYVIYRKDCYLEIWVLVFLIFLFV